MSRERSVKKCLSVSVQVVSVLRVLVFNRIIQSKNVFREAREYIRTVPLSKQSIHRSTELFILLFFFMNSM